MLRMLLLLLAQAADLDKPGRFEVRTFDRPELRDTARGGRLVPLKVHYPDADGRFPLVVFSHGGGGDRDAHRNQAEHLAGHGYVAVCVEHVRSNTERVRHLMGRAGGRLGFMEALHRITTDPEEVLQRPKDVGFAIDRAVEWNESDERLRGRIDIERIAVAGHSYGAYTTLVVCGARPILDYLDPKVEPGKGLGPDLSDPRVKVGIALSPQPMDSTVFGEGSYATIDRPLLCFSGSRDTAKGHDGSLLPAEGRLEAFGLMPEGDRTLLWLEEADHLAFSGGDERTGRLDSRARPDAQRIVKAMMLLFCDKHLKNDGAAAEALNESTANAYCGKVVKKVAWHER